jgi:hypothetical protein
MRAWFFLASVVLLPRALFAQTLPISVSGGVIVNGNTRIGPNQCGSQLHILWGPLTVNGTVCTGPRFWISNTACDQEGPTGDDRLLTPEPSTTDRNGTFSFNVNDLPIFNQSDGAVPCGSLSLNRNAYVCGFLKFNSFACSTSDQPFHAPAVTIQYRGVPPSPPDISGSALDGAIEITVNTNTDGNTVHVWLREQGTGDFQDTAQIPSDRTGVRISGLQNQTTYEVYGTYDDGVGNVSAPSQTLALTPLASEGFYGTYRGAGGQETGGCGSALPGALGIPLALGGYRLLRRKR